MIRLSETNQVCSRFTDVHYEIKPVQVKKEMGTLKNIERMQHWAKNKQWWTITHDIHITDDNKHKIPFVFAKDIPYCITVEIKTVW